MLLSPKVVLELSRQFPPQELLQLPLLSQWKELKLKHQPLEIS